MPFPGELNINNYYKGDTHEFKIYPQKTDGSIFSLSDYSNASFTIAEVRGAPLPGAVQIKASATISTDGTHIVCAITPENGLDMDSGITYVYDVQVYSPGSGTYDKIFTLLTGTISVTDDITQGIGSTSNYIQTYQVYYHNNGATSGVTPIDSNEYVANQNIVIQNGADLARIGYTFTGWTKFASGTGTVYLAGDTHPLIASDINFYPKWAVA